jgi:hypothetical protein
VCLPLTGNGFFLISTGWVPAVILQPEVEASIKMFGAASATPIPMTITGEHADRTTPLVPPDFPQGWYVGTLTIRDNGTLSAGIADAIRIAKAATTTWESFFTVSALQGAITMNLSYDPEPQIEFDSVPLEGNVPMFGTGDTTITVTPKGDIGTVSYVWYLNGIAFNLTSSPSITLHNTDFATNRNYQLSCVGYLWNGTKATRAGSVQYVLARTTIDPALCVSGVISDSRIMDMNVIIYPQGSGETQTVTSPANSSGLYPFSFVGIVPGNYKLKYQTTSSDDARYWPSEVFGGGPTTGTTIVIPNPSGFGYICNW